ncbi:hypothetical protein [Enterobacter hormaechei]|nr:hypothetical protein [Enterobacter hormaechei]
MQVEVAARTAASKQPELAEKIPEIYDLPGISERYSDRQLDVPGH